MVQGEGTNPQEGKVTVEEFARRVKEKYPQYKDVDDLELTKRIVDKYPQYKNTVSFEPPSVKKKDGAIPSAPLDGASPSQEYTEKDFFTGTFGNILKSVDEAVPWAGLGDFIDDMGRSVYTGYKQGIMSENAADLLLRGGQSTPEDIASFLQANKELQQIGSSKEMMEYQRIQQEEGGFWGVVKGIAANPSVVADLVVSSLVGMASDKDSRAAFAAALGTGGGTGAGAGAVAGGVGAVPGAVAGTLAAVPFAFGAAGAAIEMGATFAELLQEELGEGVELTKNNVKSVLEDQESYKRIRNKAIARGIVIGTIDVFTGKLAGSVGAKVLTKGGTRAVTKAPKSAVVGSLGAATAIEGVGGSAGEAAARLAIGQEMDISEIALEGIAELPGGVRNVITKAVTPAQYKINGERVDAKTAEDVINTMTLSELNTTKISIKNDYTGLQSKLDQKKKKLATRAAVQKANPNLNDQQLDEITDLQLELFEISDNKTEAGKEKTKALKSQINDITNRVEPVKTEQKIAEPTTEEAIKALNKEGIAATEETIANKKKEMVVLRQAEAQAEPAELQFTDQYNEDEVAVAEIDTTPTAENSRAETERVKQSPIEEEDGTTLNLDGTTYEGDGLVVPFASDDFTSEEVTPELIAEFVEKNKNKIPKGAKVVVGLYSFKGEDKVSIDLNVVVDEGNLAVATEFARLMGQNSIYRISDGQTVSTGETGDNTVTLMDTRARQAAVAITQGKLPQYLKGIRSPSEMAAYKAEQEKAYKKSQEKPKKQDYIDVKDLGKDERTPKGLTESKIKKLQTMVENFNKIIKKIGAQPYNITFVTSNEQYKARYRELTGIEKRPNRGTFIGRKREIIINLSNSKGLTRLSPEGTLAHEMMHAYLHALNITGKNILQLTNALYTELSNGSATEKQIARELRKFQEEYIKRNIYGKNKSLDDPNIAEEFLTEYVGIMVQYSDRIPDSGKVSFAEKIRKAVLKFLTKLGIKDKSILQAIETREEAVNFINGFVNVLSDRADVETLPTIKVEKTANPYRAQRSEMEQIETPAGSRLFNDPLEEAAELSRSYMDSKGLEYKEGKAFNTIDEKQAKRISDAFDAMKDDPTNPEVAAAYKALAEETIDQFEFIIKAGYNVEINNNEPYSSSGEMIEDLRTNKRMKIFSTESGFGDEAITEKQRSENPLLQRTKYKDVNGEPLLVNDLFRFVHDFFGHAKRGNGFGAKGEENAWDVHSRMYTPQARRAMTSETRGQNSYVNFSGVNDEAFALRDKARKLRKEGKTEEAAELVGKVYEIMKFADQKVGLLPDEFVENPYDNAPTLQEVSEDGEPVSKEQIDDSVFGKIKGTEKISKAGNQSTVRTKSGEELQNMKAEDILGGNFSPSGQATSFLANMSRGLFSYKKKGKIVSIPIAFESNSLFKSIESALKKYKNPKSTKAYPSKVKYKNHIKNDVLRPAVESASFQFKEFMKANIRQLYYSLTPEFIDASKRWYDGANRIANRLAEEYDISADQSAGILAVLSPQNDWFNNIENARQFLEVVTKYKEVSFDKDLLDAAAKYSNSKSSAPGDSEFIKRLKGYFEKYNGMSIADIEKIETDQGVDLSLVKANMVRAISMAKLPQTVNEFAPDGNVAGLYSSPHIWMTDNVIANAFGIYNDPKNTSKYLGNGNKVRNFYNNIADPNSKDGYLTADTHALAVALNVPTSAADAGGFGLFGGEKSFKYALVKDAYIEVAEELGILPRQLQSVTWEAVRTGLNEKSRKNKSKTHKLINKLKKSTLNYDERAKEIIRINPSDTPAWARKRGLTTQKTASELRQVSWSKLDEKASDGSISSRRTGDLRGRDSKLGGEPEVKEQIDFEGSEMINEFSWTEQIADPISNFKGEVIVTEKSDKPIGIKFPDGTVALVRSFDTELKEAQRLLKEVRGGIYAYLDENQVKDEISRIKKRIKRNDVVVELIDGDMKYHKADKYVRSAMPMGSIELSNDHYNNYFPRVAKMLGKDHKAGLMYSPDNTRGTSAVEIYEEFQGKGFGSRLYFAALRLLREQVPGARLISNHDFNVSRKSKNFWRSQVNNGLAKVILNTATKEEIQKIGGDVVLKQLKDIGAEYTGDIYELLDPTERTAPSKQYDVVEDSKEQIDWQRSEFGRGQVNPAIVNRTTDVQQAAVDLLEGKITNKEYQDTVKFTQPIEAITRFFLPASTKDMKESLDSNKAKLLNTPIEDGTEIGLRLDIPAYKNKNIWIVSVHDKGKSGKSISYGSVAWATDVNFGSNPKVAVFIAAGVNTDVAKRLKTRVKKVDGKTTYDVVNTVNNKVLTNKPTVEEANKFIINAQKQDKTTIARMLGKWKNFEGKTKEERDAAAIKKVEEIVAIENKYPGANRTGSPWRQIGMNPFRHSFFYDRRNGRPVIYASEVVQIGGLVYAKDVVYADKTDPMFEVEGYKDAEGETVRFQIDEKTNEAFESRQSIGEKIFGADVDNEVDNQVSQNGSWKSRPRTMFERFVDLTRLRIQDKFRRLMIVQEDIEHSSGKPVGLDQDFRNAEALMHGKAKEELNKSEEKVSKIASLIKAAGIKLEKFNELLYAMHAQERNRYLRIASTDVGASLAKLRKKLKIKPSEIAEQLGISTQEYLDIEANKETLTMDNLKYLLQIYGTSSSEFFYENAAVKDGSGMTDKEARTILAEYGMDVVDPEASQLPAKLRAAVEAVYDLTADTRQRLLDSGLETPETIEVFETTYKNYVPLRGFAEGDLDSEIIEGGRKIEVRGREKRAKGRKTKADDPLTQAIIANTTTIIRAEKNGVMTRFYNLAKNNPNEDVYKVIDPKIDKEYKTEDRGGKLRRTAKTVADYLLDPNVVAVRIDGDYKFIRFKDKRLADALKGANVVKADFMVKYLGQFNRMLSSFITTYDPEFVLRNFSRDIQTAVMNLYAEQEISEGLLKDKNIVNDVIADTLPALRAIFAVEGGITGKKKGSKNKEMDQYYREFKEDGAKTEWFYSKSSSEVQNDIENLIKGKGTNAIQAAGNLVERINSSVENAVRLSTYVNARKAGVSRAKAAELAKGLTVNFNKSGEWGQIGNTLYLFFNASVQGTSRLIRALKPRYKVDSEGNRSLQVTTAQKMAIGLSILGSLLSVLNELNSDDDEDGESFYSKIADFEKERNIIIMKPNGKDYFKIPLPYGVNVFYVAGTLIADATQKIKTPGEAAVGIMEAALGSFSPINFPTSSDVPKFLAKFVTPTVGQIPLSLAINENYFGQTIYNENFPFDTSPKPESELGRKGANRWTQEFVKFMNKATGGSEFRPGAIDINPDKIDFFMESLSGGMGKFVGRSSNVVDKVITGNWDELEPRQVPFLRVFYGQSPKYANVQDFYTRSVLVNQMYEEVKEKVITDPIARKKISKMYYLGKNLRKQLKNIKEKEDLAMKIKDPELQQARLEKLESARYRLVANYNKQYTTFEIDKLK